MEAKGTQWYSIDDLMLWKDNPNEGDVGGIIHSVNTYGYKDVIHIYHGVVMGGNHRLMALLELRKSGYSPSRRDTQLRVINGQWEITATDLSDFETQAQANGYALAMNNLTRKGRNDDVLLLNVLQDVASVNMDWVSGAGYDGDDMDALGLAVNPAWQEFDENVANDVEWNECPDCGHKWPK